MIKDFRKEYHWHDGNTLVVLDTFGRQFAVSSYGPGTVKEGEGGYDRVTRRPLLHSIGFTEEHLDGFEAAIKAWRKNVGYGAGRDGRGKKVSIEKQVIGILRRSPKKTATFLARKINCKLANVSSQLTKMTHAGTVVVDGPFGPRGGNVYSLRSEQTSLEDMRADEKQESNGKYRDAECSEEGNRG